MFKFIHLWLKSNEIILLILIARESSSVSLETTLTMLNSKVQLKAIFF